MKFKLLFAVCLLFTSFAHAQNMTGIWRGTFLAGIGMFKEKYNYEVQINQLPNKALRGVTYSYHLTTFYGKALLKGVYNPTTKNIIFKEDTLVEMRAGFGTSACLFTCYLDYHKDGKVESLQGTFTSVKITDGGDCGGGTVYLERVRESDFHKEEFLLKKHPSTRQNSPAPTQTHPSQKPKSPVITHRPPPLKKDTSELSIQKPIPKPSIIDSAPPVKPVPPPAITSRENNLVRRITTNSPNIKIDLYDNGEIDGDTITVYHNNEVVAYKKLLSKDPITIHVTATVKDNLHEFVMYADNLGKIPPNTALMVITTGGKRYELSVSSSLQKNAKVVVQYQP
jgi:hypothetical protein